MADEDSPDINFSDIGQEGKKIFGKMKKSRKDTKKKETTNSQGNQESNTTISEVYGSPDDEVFSLGYDRKGMCLIFNHTKFKVKNLPLDDRPASDKDAEALKNFFEHLEFDVDTHNDKKKKEIENILQEARNKDHSDAYGFVCCVLSHGSCIGKQDIIYAEDNYYFTEDLFTPFENCQSLAGKPKMFFIQACRGRELDSGITVIFNYLKSYMPSFVNVAHCASIDDSVVQKLYCKIPKKADFLVAYSSPKNCMAWKRDEMGSWFIQTLCAKLNERAEDLDLLSILTIVNRRVAFDFESQHRKDVRMNNMKEVPSICSTLTKRIHFSNPLHLSISSSDGEESFEDESG